MTRGSKPLDLAPAQIAELRSLAMRLNTIIANAEQQAAAYRAIGANIRRVLAGLGYPADDPVFDRDVRVVQGLDDVRGQVEAEVAALATLAGDIRRLVDAQGTQGAQIAALHATVTDLAAADAAIAKMWGGGPLVSESFVIQANEVLRDLRADIHRQPEIAANAMVLALGAALRPLLTEILAPLLDERAAALETRRRPRAADDGAAIDRAA